MKPIPIGTRFYKNKSLPASTQNLINMYVDILDIDTKSQTVCHLKPCNKAWFTVGSGPIRGLCKMNNVLYVVSRYTLYSVNSAGVSVVLGTIPGVGPVSMAVNLVGQLMVVNGTDIGYVYSTDAGFDTTTLIGEAYTVRHSDGYFIFEHYGTNNWFISSNTDGLVFDTTETGGTNKRGDKVLGIETTQNRVLVFGEETVEGFFVQTSLDFPYSKDRGLSLTKGTLSRWSISSVDELVFWLGNDYEVYMMAGLQTKRISDPNLSYVIRKMTDPSDCVGCSYTHLGHTFYKLNFITDNVTYVFDATSQIWSQWGQLNNGDIIREKATYYIDAYGKQLVGDYTSNNIYELDSDTYNDNGDAVRWEMILPPIHNNGAPFNINELVVSMEPGTGLSVGQGDDPQLFMSISTNAKIFNSPRWVGIGKIGEYDNKVHYTQVGYTEDTLYVKLAGSDPVKWAINGVYIR